MSTKHYRNSRTISISAKSSSSSNNPFILLPLFTLLFVVSLRCAICYTNTHYDLTTIARSNSKTMSWSFVVPLRRAAYQLIKYPQHLMEQSRRERNTRFGYRSTNHYCNHHRRWRLYTSKSNPISRNSRVTSSCSHDLEHGVVAARLILNDWFSIRHNPTIIRKANVVEQGLDDRDTKLFNLLHINDRGTSTVPQSKNSSNTRFHLSQQHIMYAADLLDTKFNITTVVQRENEKIQQETLVGSESNHTRAVLTTEEFSNLKTSLEDTFDCVILDTFIDFNKRGHLQHVMEVASSVTKLGGVVALRGPTSEEDSCRLPDLIHFLPLKLLSMEKGLNTEDYSDSLQEGGHTLAYTSFVRVPHCALKSLLRLRGPVSSGYGRGGKKLGIPTANLPESLFANALLPLPAGVYFGWAVIEGHTHDNEKRGRNFPFKAVVNVGYSPTFVGEENREKIVEAHLLSDADEIEGDFYYETMRLSLIGSLRPEKKFASFSDLLAAIHLDIRCAKEALQSSPFSDYQKDPFLSIVNLNPWVGADGGDETASWEYETVSLGAS